MAGKGAKTVKTRKPQFTGAEKSIIREFVRVNKAILECTDGKASSNYRKRSKWDELSKKCSAVSGIARDGPSVDKAWRNMCSSAKTAKAKERKSTEKTGGGETSSSSIDKDTEEVLAVIGEDDPTITGHPSGLDINDDNYTLRGDDLLANIHIDDDDDESIFNIPSDNSGNGDGRQSLVDSQHEDAYEAVQSSYPSLFSHGSPGISDFADKSPTANVQLFGRRSKLTSGGGSIVTSRGGSIVTSRGGSIVTSGGGSAMISGGGSAMTTISPGKSIFPASNTKAPATLAKRPAKLSKQPTKEEMCVRVLAAEEAKHFALKEKAQAEKAATYAKMAYLRKKGEFLDKMVVVASTVASCFQPVIDKQSVK